jgi:sensor histidine kinase YesM
MLIQLEEWAQSQMETVTNIMSFLFGLLILITVWRVINWAVGILTTILWPIVGLVLVMVRILRCPLKFTPEIFSFESQYMFPELISEASNRQILSNVAEKFVSAIQPNF